MTARHLHLERSRFGVRSGRQDDTHDCILPQPLVNPEGGLRVPSQKDEQGVTVTMWREKSGHGEVSESKRERLLVSNACVYAGPLCQCLATLQAHTSSYQHAR